MKKITRLELYIDGNDFTEFERYNYWTDEYFKKKNNYKSINYDLQDNGRTLKISIKK